MKPKNFPERVRQRRLRAVERLTANIAKMRESASRLDGNPMFTFAVERLECRISAGKTEAKRLSAMLANGSRRHVTTKKDRSDRAAFQRRS